VRDDVNQRCLLMDVLDLRDNLCDCLGLSIGSLEENVRPGVLALRTSRTYFRP
jgi:hypothetical protein